MKVSVNWMRLMNRNYGCSDGSELADVDKLLDKIGSQLGAVEEVVELGQKYKGILVVKVVECQKHPNADKLSLCLIDDGGVDKKVKRDKDGLIQIVCGGPNVKAGMLVAWIPPGAAVPSTIDKEPFVIEARPIRNKTSHGMLASPKELDLGDNHEGILTLDSGKPGNSLIDNLQLDDYIIDIENKMFTHRPDCFGLLGIAREIAGVNQKPFKSPAWYQEDADLPADGRKNVLRLAVKNEVPKLVPRFCAVAIKDIKVQPSPAWLQSFLARSGIRPINNIVDITNWFMLATAQPLHAYDYDKVVGETGEGRGATLCVRLSKKGESLKLLNSKEITLNEGAVVITGGVRPIGLGGIMGGADTEVDKSTKNIIFECANFDMNQTRHVAFEYGLFTDAATRFTKNQSPRQNRAVLVKTVHDTLQLVGGRVASSLIDDYQSPAASRELQVVRTSAEFINSRLGLKLSASEIKKLLENVEFKVEIAIKKPATPQKPHLQEPSLQIRVPFWRTDIEIPEDIVEEVGRLYGYDKLPMILPKRDLAPAEKNQMLEFKAHLRQILKRAGANEVLTYSFVHGSLMQKAGQDPKDAYHIRNALSPDLQYYRLSLTPSLLEKIHPNIRAGFDEFAIFEIGKGHNQKMKDKSGLPVESEMLSMVMASKTNSAKNNGSPYYEARRILDYLATELGTELEYRPVPEEEPYPASKPFDHRRSAQVWDASSKIPLGMVGEYKQSVTQNLKLPAYCAGFEIGIEQLMQIVPQHKQYMPISRFPELEQDFNLRTDAGLNYKELTDFVYKNLSKLSEPHGYNFQIEPLDIFQKASDKTYKQTTWRTVLWHPERTLTTDETNKLLDRLADKAKKELNAERI